MESVASRSALVPQPFGPNWLRNWLERHQHPFSFYIHLVGIPMTIAAFPFLFVGSWLWFLGLFISGYGLQFIGHAVEGNDAGEWILVKKKLGLPYVDVAPRQTSHPDNVRA